MWVGIKEVETTIVYDVFLSARDKWYIVVGRFGFVAQELITKSPVSLEAFTKGNRLRRRLLFQTFPLCLIKRAQKSFFPSCKRWDLLMNCLDIRRRSSLYSSAAENFGILMRRVRTQNERKFIFEKKNLLK